MKAETFNREVIVGVDLGGTKILAGIFTPQLRFLQSSKLNTKSERGFDAVVQRIARCVLDALDAADLTPKQVCALGIGAPGAVNPRKGEVIFAPNLAWENAPLQKELERLLGIPVFVENDCNVSALGIYEVELQRKHQNILGIFIGTGIGGGIILDGKLFSGFNRTAGEIGHMVIDATGPKCRCGRSGCFEALASRTAIFRELALRVAEGEKTLLTELLQPGELITHLKSGDLRKALRLGDKLTERVIKKSAEYTGIAVANLANILGPEVVVLGGGVMDALENEMMPIIVETAQKYAMPGVLKGVQIIASSLGDQAGINGAAVLGRQRTKEKLMNPRRADPS